MGQESSVNLVGGIWTTEPLVEGDHLWSQRRFALGGREGEEVNGEVIELER